MTLDPLAYLTAGAIGFPVLGLVATGLPLLIGRRVSERAVSRIVELGLGSALSFAVLLTARFFVGGGDQQIVRFGRWFSLGEYGFELDFLVDRLSLAFLLLTLVLGVIVARFSRTYLHRDPGYHRFFLLLAIFVLGMELTVLAATIDLLFAGWELLGLASALLIAFFPDRRQSAENSLVAWAIYRFGDIGILAAAVLMHHFTHSADFAEAFGQRTWPAGFPHVSAGAAQLIAGLLLFSALAKSAQLPFSPWLPRAVEGPTPSTAIFYGGISIHAGAYLLLRSAPLLDRSPLVEAALVVLGLTTALFASAVGRVQADAKGQLAYASMAQVGLIFAEIGLGLRFLALLHIAGHASVRTLQFLRAPSVLGEFHRMSAGRGGELARRGLHYELLLPERVRERLFALAHQGLGVESFGRYRLMGPLLRLLERIEAAEASLAEGSLPEARPKDERAPVAQ